MVVPPFKIQNTFGSLSSGSYSVLVEDVNGCQTSWGNVLFTNPTELIISAVNMVTPLCYDSCNGQIDIVASGGSGNLFLFYRWWCKFCEYRYIS